MRQRIGLVSDPVDVEPTGTGKTRSGKFGLGVAVNPGQMIAGFKSSDAGKIGFQPFGGNQWRDHHILPLCSVAVAKPT